MSGDQIYGDGPADDMDVDSVLPEHGKPDKVAEAERMREERDAEQNGDTETVEVAREQLDELLDRVSDLEAEMQRKDSRIDELEQRLDERAAVYWDGNDSRDAVIESTDGVEFPLGSALKQKVTKDEIIGDGSDILAEIEEQVSGGPDAAELKSDIRKEVRERSRGDGRLSSQIQTLANELDVDLKEISADELDKVARLANNGPTDVADGRVTAVHERAAALVRRYGEWSSPVKKAGRQQFAISWPDAKEKLELVRNENLQTSQIRRVFEKLETLAADSPRSVVIEEHDSGTANRFRMELTEDEYESWTMEDQ